MHKKDMVDAMLVVFSSHFMNFKIDQYNLVIGSPA